MYRNICDTEDYGPEPFVLNLEEETTRNCNFRRALWTGCYLQMTLMCIPVGGEIGLEVHKETDQFLRVEKGRGIVKMGECKERLNEKLCVCDGYGIFIPAGTWHNVVNRGNCPLKLYSIYAPPHHPHGTVHRTKHDADIAENMPEY